MADLREQLLEVRREYGMLTPRSVVSAARPASSPLHAHFEWDNEIAGEAYRLNQARELIRSVRIKYTAEDGSMGNLRGFVSVTRGDTPGREYATVEEVAADPILAAIALKDAEREWRELFSRYRSLAGFIDLVQKDLLTEVL